MKKYFGLTIIVIAFPEIRQTKTVPDYLPETGSNFGKSYLLVYLSKNYKLPIKVKLYVSTLILESSIVFG